MTREQWENEPMPEDTGLWTKDQPAPTRMITVPCRICGVRGDLIVGGFNILSETHDACEPVCELTGCTKTRESGTDYCEPHNQEHADNRDPKEPDWQFSP